MSRRITFQLVVIIALLTSVMSQNEPITKHDFTRRFVDLLVSKVEKNNVQIIEDLQINITHHDTLRNQCILNNAYAEYLNNLDGMDDILKRYMEVCISILGLSETSSLDLDVSKVLPVIRDSTFVDEYAKLTKTEAFAEKINEVLFILYVIDDSLSFRYLTNQQAHNLNSLFDLRLLAISNLRRAVLPVTEGYDLGSKVYGFVAGGNYESSLLLLDEIWTKQNFPIQGEFVVSIPSRDLLFVTGSEDSVGVNYIKEKLLELRTVSLDHQISWDLFIRQDSSWVIYNSILQKN